jgi:hypothetical protein
MRDYMSSDAHARYVKERNERVIHVARVSEAIDTQMTHYIVTSLVRFDSSDAHRVITSLVCDTEDKAGNFCCASDCECNERDSDHTDCVHCDAASAFALITRYAACDDYSLRKSLQHSLSAMHSAYMTRLLTLAQTISSNADRCIARIERIERQHANDDRALAYFVDCSANVDALRAFLNTFNAALVRVLTFANEITTTHDERERKAHTLVDDLFIELQSASRVRQQLESLRDDNELDAVSFTIASCYLVACEREMNSSP